MRTAFKHSIGLRLKVIAAGIVATSVAGIAHATTVYDTSLADPPGFYNGSGNPNLGFTVNTINGIELGLAVQYRKDAQVHPTSTNVYNVSTGFYSLPPADSCTGFCARWNFEFSVNLGATGLKLSDINPKISILNLVNLQQINFNPLGLDNTGWDGTNTHAATGTDIGFQNSENLSFAFVPFLNPLFAFDPNQNNTYIIALSVLDQAGAELGSVSETVIARTGAAPIPAALPLFAGGLGAIGFAARRRKKKKAAEASA